MNKDRIMLIALVLAVAGGAFFYIIVPAMSGLMAKATKVQALMLARNVIERVIR